MILSASILPNLERTAKFPRECSTLVGHPWANPNHLLAGGCRVPHELSVHRMRNWRLVDSFCWYERTIVSVARSGYI